MAWASSGSKFISPCLVSGLVSCHVSRRVISPRAMPCVMSALLACVVSSAIMSRYLVRCSIACNVMSYIFVLCSRCGTSRRQALVATHRTCKRSTNAQTPQCRKGFRILYHSVLFPHRFMMYSFSVRIRRWVKTTFETVLRSCRPGFRGWRRFWPGMRRKALMSHLAPT